MTYDDTTKKFSSTKRYKTCSDHPRDHDSIMSDAGAIDDGPGNDPSSSPNTPRAGLPLSSPESGSQSKGSGEVKQPSKTWASDIAKTDVTMIDVGAEKLPLIDAANHMLDIKPPPSKAGENNYASDPRKLEKLHSFDHVDNEEPFKA